MKNFKNIAIILPLFTLSSCQPGKQVHEDHDYQTNTNAIYYGSIDVTNSFDSVVKLFGKTSECSGTLISPRLVLTNAHCTKANLYVTNLNDFDVDDPMARVSKIRKMIKHPDFFDYGGPESPIEYDLALAILDKEIKIEKYPSVIKSEYEFTRNLSLHHNRVRGARNAGKLPAARRPGAGKPRHPARSRRRHHHPHPQPRLCRRPPG